MYSHKVLHLKCSRVYLVHIFKFIRSFLYYGIVHDYIIINKLETSQFKDPRPALTWIKNFIKRNKLTHKKAEMISSARKSNTANLFIIYNFFDYNVKVKKNKWVYEGHIYSCLKCFCIFIL